MIGNVSLPESLINLLGYTHGSERRKEKKRKIERCKDRRRREKQTREVRNKLIG